MADSTTDVSIATDSGIPSTGTKGWMAGLAVVTLAAAGWCLYLSASFDGHPLDPMVLQIAPLALLVTGLTVLIMAAGLFLWRTRAGYWAAFAAAWIVQVEAVYLMLHFDVDAPVRGSGPAIGFTGFGLVIVARYVLPWLRHRKVWCTTLPEFYSPEAARRPRSLLANAGIWLWGGYRQLQAELERKRKDEEVSATEKQIVKDLFPSRDHRQPGGTVRENVEAIIVALIMALVLRSFAVEAFRIPTDSMQPTLSGEHLDEGGRLKVSGDRILVNKYSYAMDHPDWTLMGTTLLGALVMAIGLALSRRWKRGIGVAVALGGLAVGAGVIAAGVSTYEGAEQAAYSPSRYDVVVFKYPLNTKRNFIKRLVGMPEEDLCIWKGNVWTRPAPGGVSQPDTTFTVTRKPAEVQREIWIRHYTYRFAGRATAVGLRSDQCQAPIRELIPGPPDVSDWTSVHPEATPRTRSGRRYIEFPLPENASEPPDVWGYDGDGGPDTWLVAADPPPPEADLPARLAYCKYITDSFHLPADDAEFAALDARYQQDINEANHRMDSEAVGDLRITGIALLTGEAAELTVVLHREYDDYRLTLRGDGTADCTVRRDLGREGIVTLSRDEAEGVLSLTEELNARDVVIAAGEPIEVDFGQADHRVYITLNGVHFRPWDVPPAQDVDGNLAGPPAVANDTLIAYSLDSVPFVAFDARGGEDTEIRLRNLQIWRDLHYRATDIVDPAVTIPPDRFLMLGDNSPDSKDSRSWYRGVFEVRTPGGSIEMIYAELDPPPGESGSRPAQLGEGMILRNAVGDPVACQRRLRDLQSLTQEEIWIEDTQGVIRRVPTDALRNFHVEEAPFVGRDQIIGQALIRFWPIGTLDFIR